MTYSIVQDVGKVSVAVLDDEGGESKSVRLDAAVERVVARVGAADATPPFEEGLTGRRAYALDVVRKRVRQRLRRRWLLLWQVRGLRLEHGGLTVAVLIFSTRSSWYRRAGCG